MDYIETSTNNLHLCEKRLRKKINLAFVVFQQSRPRADGVERYVRINSRKQKS